MKTFDLHIQPHLGATATAEGTRKACPGRPWGVVAGDLGFARGSGEGSGTAGGRTKG